MYLTYSFKIWPSNVMDNNKSTLRVPRNNEQIEFWNCIHLISSEFLTLMSLGSAVGIATEYGLDNRGLGFRVPLG
jgi:hypothetical protein